MGTVRVIRGPRWPGRAIASAFVVVGVVAMLTDPQGVANGVGILIILGVMALLLEYATERPGVFLSDEAMTYKPVAGRARRIPWSDIRGFTAGTKIIVGRGGGTFAVVVADVAGRRRPLRLSSTLSRATPAGRARVQRLADDLTAELHRRA
jgi:hypothetical protein